LQVVKERFYLIMDFIEGPDLEELLLQNGGRPLEEESVLDWALQIATPLKRCTTRA
jgi:serine/threonine protein kinase